MPYSAEHKQITRANIVECARMMFNRYGYQDVSIDRIMEEAGLTRGGFYNHFRNKEELFAAAIEHFLENRGAQWRNEAGVDPEYADQMAVNMINGYLSAEHLGDLEGQCPLIALPSDTARASGDVQSSYQTILTAMVGLFERSLEAANDKTPRHNALVLASLCVGGMVLARTLPDSQLAEEVRSAAQTEAEKLANATRHV